MRRRSVAFISFTCVGLVLTGCAMFRFEKREPWRAEAENACITKRLVRISDDVTTTAAIDGPGACGMEHPFRVLAFADGSVRVKTRQTLACPIIPTIDSWFRDIVNPAAQMYFGMPVVELNAGSYSCRGRNNQRGARLSEHAFGNAFDVMSFKFADGSVVTVKNGWRGTSTEQEFLREVFVGSCTYFTTVLGPGSDSYHSDHFHLDLARHDSSGQRRYCRPVLKFTPRLIPGGNHPPTIASVPALPPIPASRFEDAFAPASGALPSSPTGDYGDDDEDSLD